MRYVLVMSGKGGVGKSTTAANIARSLAKNGKRVGVMDLDLTGPSIPTLFGIQEKELSKTRSGKIIPYTSDSIEIVSLALVLANPNDPVIWRGPKKRAAINEFFKSTQWTCDIVVVDMPPGTGDEHITTLNLMETNKCDYKIVVVTTPNTLAVADVRKGINLCRSRNAPICGIIENFRGVMCPCCGEVTQLLGEHAAEKMSKDFGIPIIAQIPFLPKAAEANSTGRECDLLMGYFNKVVNVLD